MCSTGVRLLSITGSECSQTVGVCQLRGSPFGLLWLEFFIVRFWQDKAERLNRIIPTFCWWVISLMLLKNLAGKGEPCWQSRGNALFQISQGVWFKHVSPWQRTPATQLSNGQQAHLGPCTAHGLEGFIPYFYFIYLNLLGSRMKLSTSAFLSLITHRCAITELMKLLSAEISP